MGLRTLHGSITSPFTNNSKVSCKNPEPVLLLQLAKDQAPVHCNFNNTRPYEPHLKLDATLFFAPQPASSALRLPNLGTANNTVSAIRSFGG
ncbi:hypothetical protein ACFX2I_004269 [Malus domestica]